MEIHRRPVKASEVMLKNPRHCVTRPDVFKFPWIVVRPESILEPGNVFFIVPNHTIHSLLQAYESSVENPKNSTRRNKVRTTLKSTRTQPIYDSGEPQLPEGTKSKKLGLGLGPGPGPDHPQLKRAHLRPSPSKPPSLKPHQPHHQSLNRSPPKSKCLKLSRPHVKCCDLDDDSDDHNHGKILVMKGRSIRPHIYHEEHDRNDEVKLKPCRRLNKEYKRSKAYGLKVRFDLPDEDGEK